MKKDNELATTALGCIGAIVLMPISLTLNGFCIHLIWFWFITSYYHIAAPTIPVALGLSCLVSCFTTPAQKKPVEEDKNIITLLLESVYRQVFLLLIAFLIHLFITIGAW